MTSALPYVLRNAEPDDCAQLFELIKALAEYEKLSHAVLGDASALREHLFGATKYAEVIVTEVGGKIVGFALFFHNYSTFLTKPGIYLEDIFVLPSYRRKGMGSAMLSKVAEVTVARKCGRLEWSVLDWNQPALEFYAQMGASLLEEWKICRVTDGALLALGHSEE